MKGECDVCLRDGVPLQWAADGTEDLLCERCAAYFNDPERAADLALDAELADLERADRRVKARARISLLRLLDRRELQLRERAELQRRARARLKEHLRSPAGLTLGLGLLGFAAFQLLAAEPEPEPDVDPKDLN